MPSLPVDPFWYARAWLTEPAPSRAARLGWGARRVARRLARAPHAVAALLAVRLQQANERSPSFR